ncbi:GT4 family glycosyltransferase PelF [Rhodanobacter sp. AS-Z3]|uniref:GT4 family glycosyltransferase PelF n=1 Tax=Rhodanobacter sp. AS-Z3 TaxID=3031330 RepID=UPI002479134D|nr:GT4 family glycosyltransferase PelF [Rhodanobacter sp. AS-Z3]WEN15824.1 GT4 family glycosyltransferase PelF [Rhodanobacter sp. AS-Z3]
MTDAFAVDILLLLEGTYPYVKGGVSSWVHEIIRGMPQFRFGIVFLGSRESDYAGWRYELPTNVAFVQSHFLFDAVSTPPKLPCRRDRGPSPTIEAALREFHEKLQTACPDIPSSRQLADPASPVGHGMFLDSDSAWQYLTERYETSALAESFVDYFWTVRNLHAPLWILGQIAAKVPPARLFFSPSTGYAGLLGAMCSQQGNAPYVLMEHGIYTRERRIDMMKAEWIRDHRNFLQTDQGEISHLRSLWVQFFETASRQSYSKANPVISLFDRARRQQIADGADEARTRIIPNGVEIERFRGLRRALDAPVPQVMALIGRVVPIKDIKNFIRAAAIAGQKLPHLQAWIIGPTEEDPPYADECRELVQSLGLENIVQFLGFRRVEDVLPGIGVNVLSSVSEGLPLSVLEGFAAGIPAVTTDVGACREMLEGSGRDDDVSGVAGGVAGLADPDGLASHIVSLLSDPQRYREAVETAIARVEKRYDRLTMLATFERIFREAMD